jgi:uncharacterized membrane protein YjgN (DUF898 family)
MEHAASHFEFDGTTTACIGTTALAAVVTVGSLGLAFPVALVFHRRWRASHTIVNGRRLEFTGSTRELFAIWWPAYLWTVLTLGLYGFVVYPHLLRWTWEHTTFGAWQSERSAASHAGVTSESSRLPLAFVNEPGRHQLAG